MIDQALFARLEPTLTRLRWRRVWTGSALGLIVAAAVAWYAHTQVNNYTSMEVETPPERWAWFSEFRRQWLPGGLLLGSLGALIGWSLQPKPSRVAREVESEFPDLDGRLTTALEQKPGDDGNFSFLQAHLFAETIRHSTEKDWLRAVSPASVNWTRATFVAALALFISCWVQLPNYATSPGEVWLSTENGVKVTPGDTELEKGSALVLLARFTSTMPAAAELVIGDSAESERRISLTRSLSDPVFGGSVADVKESFTYKVAWDGGGTRDYKVSVFEFPKLERSDVTLTYPDYTKLPPKRIEDTRHTAAVEGTRLDLELALNKPVVSAVLEPRKAKDAAVAEAALTLEVSPDKAFAVLRGYTPEKNARYDLVLTDADGRRSKQSVPFSFDVVPNRVPEMKLASPKGDQKPSALQEMLFDGTVWDDFGVVACGLEVATPGGEAVMVEFGKDVPAKEKRAFQEMLRFEELSAAPDQLFAWHTWADDIGPDGKVRRTKGDLFFAEIRHFEEIFRQGEGMESQQQQQQQQEQQQQQGQGEATELAKLQKQIISATWKLAQKNQTDRSDPSDRTDPADEKRTADVKVVRDSQEDAHTQAGEASTEAVGEPQTAALWQSVLQHMQQALERLDKATAAPPDLASALAPEQAAYQALLKLQAREHQVSRQQQQQQQQGQPGQCQGEQQQQQQLDQLDLAKNEDRYETQREAQAQQSAERREQAQVLNRLKELAERQGDVNEKLKELQTALSEAKTEQEKEEARRELKRLEEEQRQMLADADELKQRMEQQQNQSQKSKQREQLDQARENMQQAAEAAAQGQASQALASGTRAEQQMQEMREELRKQSAGAFEEELREMRAEARELARKQEEIAREMKPDQSDQSDPTDPTDPTDPKKPPTLSGGPDEEKLTQALNEQQQRTGDLVQRATELSEQAEPAEPLLSRQIYETARQFAQDDAGAVKEAQQEMLREGRLSQQAFEELKQLQEQERAGKALRLTAELQQQQQTKQAARTGERARQGLNQLRQGIEQATESVIGDDTAALRLAESQLQAASEAMQREMEQSNASQPNNRGSGFQPEANQPNNEQTREGQPQTAQNQPGEGQPSGRQPGQRQGNGQPQGQQQPGERQPNEGNQEVAQKETQQRQPQQGEGQQPGEGERTAQNRGPRQPGAANGGRGSGAQENFETARGPRGNRQTASPLTGDGFADWSDSLREAEELVEGNDLRNEIAQARERARQMRLDMKKADKKPDWAVVQLEIVKPLVEVRNRVREELARRDSDKALVPVDRDPVPAQFSENVRRYYEQLGKE